MATLTHPAVDMSHVTELLETAYRILRRHHDDDVVEKIRILQCYLDLSQMSPKGNYDHMIRKAFDELTKLVHLHPVN